MRRTTRTTSPIPGFCLLPRDEGEHRIVGEAKGVDPQTLDAYTRMAPKIAARYRASQPLRVHQLIRAFFQADAPTADVGCGCGRDVEWLSQHRYPATGFDASEPMLAEARRCYPAGQFEAASLSALIEVQDAAFANVLCSAVLMRVPREHLITSVLSLARILREVAGWCSATAVPWPTPSAIRTVASSLTFPPASSRCCSSRPGTLAAPLRLKQGITRLLL